MNGDFFTIISVAYEMTSLPDILFFVFLTIFQLYIAPVRTLFIVPGRRGRARRG